MENLIEQYQDDKNIIKGIKEMNLLQTNEKFSVGQIIQFYAGYNSNILMKSKITGFDENGNIYVLWDCYWSPIQDDKVRKIKNVKSKLCSKVLQLLDADFSYKNALEKVLHNNNTNKEKLEKELNFYI